MTGGAAFGEFDLDFRKGRDGGESGLDAEPPLLALFPVVGASPPEKKNMKKPMQRMPARTIVIGLERRNERDIVMEEQEKKTSCNRQRRSVYEECIRKVMCLAVGKIAISLKHKAERGR